jgi:arginine decarboxylase
MSNSDWSIEKSAQLYNLGGWGGVYFNINQKGHIVAHPFGQPGPMIDLMDVVDDIRERKLGFPCIVRFQDVLRSRVKQLNEVFRAAIAQHNYKGGYFGVYPTKVNQMREVVEEILDAGARYHFGLEAGSKGELLIVLALNTDPEALTICNGYKDEEYLRLALLGRKLGRKIFVVIEKLSELPHLLRLAEEMNVQPLIVLRSKLSTKGTGKWESSSGDFAKFGLTTPELIRAVEMLKAAGKLEAAKLFHFHVGSQLTDIRTVKDVVNEGARFYAKLRKMGLGLEYFDVGGGLGVDYVGARSTAYVSSLNYTMDEYAADVVYTVQQICTNEGVPEPHIVSESGRALTAHHSCLLMNVFGHIEFGENGAVHEEPAPPSGVSEASNSPVPEAPVEAPIVREMREIVANLSPKNSGEAYNDAVAKKEQALSMFKLGILGLEERAAVEGLYWRLCRRLVEINKKRKRVPGPTRGLDDKLADQYMANFSLFQSAPDSWAINQLFPIAPLHRHGEAPTRDSTIFDITCDSDGKIDTFIESETVDETIPLHPCAPASPTTWACS